MDKFRAMRRLRQQLSEKEESISILRKSTAGTLALLATLLTNKCWSGLPKMSLPSMDM